MKLHEYHFVDKVVKERKQMRRWNDESVTTRIRVCKN